MPITVAAILNFIPTNIWGSLKKFITKKDDIIVFDIPFKLSTKYTPALLIVMTCLSFANQFVRNIEMDCAASGSSGGGGGGSSGGWGGGGSQGSGGNSALNDFCWNYETFLVAKALKPAMRGSVTYPGISGYNKDKDELLTQRYYKYIWLASVGLAVGSFLPLFFWKFRGTEKIKSLVQIIPEENATEDETRVSYYLETIGSNGSFAGHYAFCKFLAAFSPFGQWYYLCGFIGKLYMYYGINVLFSFMDDSDSWPNPMDAVFPKVAKCEWSKYGFSGDREVKAAQCQLPMNNLTQWSFFLYWWWLALVLVINAVSFIRLVLIFFPPYRKWQYRKFVGRACRKDLEQARTYTIHSNGEMIRKKHSKRAIIDVNLSFGDWLVLDFMKRNLEDWKFRDFVRRMVVTENIVLQLKPIKTDSNGTNGTSSGNGGKLYQNGHNSGGANKLVNMEIGFKQSVLNGGSLPPTYVACETPDWDKNELSPPLNNGMLESPSPFPTAPPQLHSAGNNGIANDSAVDPPGEGYSFVISPPVKIDRSNFKKVAPPAERKKDLTQNNKPSSSQQNYTTCDDEGWD